MFTQKELQEVVKEAISKAIDAYKNGDLEYAEIIAKQLGKVDTENPDSFSILGLILHKKQQYTEAIEVIKKSLEIKPTADAHNNISLCYGKLGMFPEAIDHLNQAIEIDSNPAYYSNLGLQYRQAKNFDKAIQVLETSIALESTPTAWFNLGGVYGEMRDINKAIDCFNQCIKLDQNFHAAHVDLAYSYFLLGDYSRGWIHYEHRLNHYTPVKYFEKRYDFSKLWDGSNVKNKRLVIWSEQGLGDLIHFSRWIKLLECDVAIEVENKECLSLIKHNFPRAIVQKDCSQLDFDYHCSVMSLPFLLKTEEASHELYTISTYNYPTDKFKIGICWAGNPQHPGDSLRSFKLELFKKISKMPEIQLFSLQKDWRPRIYLEKKEVVDLAENCDDLNIIKPELNDLDKTLAVIKSMDLVITADTLVLHLAGAANIKTYALIPFNPDWRWGLTGKTTKWYPTIEIFRQTKSREWNDCFREIELKIKQILKTKMDTV